MTKDNLSTFLDERLTHRKSEVVNLKQLHLDIHEKRIVQKDDMSKFQANKSALIATKALAFKA